jgi:thiol-disulfide isomerase/thioredoxin
MPKRRVSAGKNNIFNSKNSQNILCCVVVVLIGVGLIMLAQKNNLFRNNSVEGFTDSQPMELDRISEPLVPANDKFIIVLVYVDWCPHCRTVKPAWKNLQNRLNNTTINGKQVHVAAVNAEGNQVEKDFANSQSVQGYPTIKVMNNNNVDEYNGGRNEQELESFINSSCGGN